MLERTIKDIKSLKIQGAENIAKASIKAIGAVLNESKKQGKDLHEELLSARKKLENARPTEPCLRNTMTQIFSDLNEDNIRHKAESNIQKAQNHFDISEKTIAEFGAHKIRQGMTIFTHCHSNTVISIFKEAKKQKIGFSVKNTETRPLFQGRTTAKELAKIGIPVEHFIDSAGRLAIKESDLMLIGADAITSEGFVINKIGSELFAETAAKKGVPIYVCTNSWKFDIDTVYGFDEEIEKRHEEEVWKEKPKGVKISNYAFEMVSPELISGVISEIGVYSPKVFIGEMQRHYPWLFQGRKKKILQH